MPQALTINAAVGLYANILDAMKQKGMSAKDYPVQEYRLRQNAALSASNKGYSLKLGSSDQGGSSDDPTANRLPTNDMFVIFGHSMGVAKIPNPATVPGFQLANARVFTWPESSVFDYAPAGSVGENAAIQGLFNGFMDLKVNSDFIVEHLSTEEFQVYQPTDTKGQGGNYPDLNARVPVILPGYPTLTGNLQISANFQFLGDFTNINGDTNEKNYLVYELFGFRIVNGASPVFVEAMANFF